MLRTILAAALVTATAAVPARPAAAGHLVARCMFETAGYEGTQRGVAFGYVAGDADDTVSVSCVVEVYGEPVASTPATPGTGAAVTYAPLEFALSETDPVEYCTVTTVNGATESACYPVHALQVPPQFVYDAVYDLLYQIDLTWLCPFFAALAGDYGAVSVKPEGDVFVAGESWFDCPPYDVWG